MPMYDHYTVHRATVKCSLLSIDGSYGALCILALKDSSTTSADIGTVIENGRCVYSHIGMQNSGRSCLTLEIDCDHSLFFGRDVFAGDKYQGTSSSSPSDGVFLHVGVIGVGNVDTGHIYATTEITYHARLSEPVLLASS